MPEAAERREPKRPHGKGRSNLDWLKEIQDQPDLPSRAKGVAAAMAMVTPSKTMQCYMSTALLRHRTSYCKDTVQAARADLVATGYLRLLRRGNNVGGNTSSVYMLVFPKR